MFSVLSSPSGADLPLAILAASIWTYWVGAMRMVVRVRRKSRSRTAGLVPRQPLERALWVLWVPAVLAWLALPVAALFAGEPPLAPSPDLLGSPLAVPIRWAGAAAAVAALCGTMRCWKLMGRSWRMGVVPGERTALVTSGIYGRVRHPIYALSLLLMASTAAVLPTAPIGILALVHAALLGIKARNEEKFLLGAHGEAYAEYLRRTGAFFPRLSGRSLARP